MNNTSEQAIKDSDSLVKFDNFIGLMNFFHVSRCQQISCCQCGFTAEL